MYDHCLLKRAKPDITQARHTDAATQTAAGPAARPASPPLLQWQRCYGNRYVQRLVAQTRQDGTAAEAPAIEPAVAPTLGAPASLQCQPAPSGAKAQYDPGRLTRLAGLLQQITQATAESHRLRSELDALPPASSDRRTSLDAALTSSRTQLITLLTQRIALLDEEIAGLTARIGPNPVCKAPSVGADAAGGLGAQPVCAPDSADTLGLELMQRENERRRHEQQLRPLQRWKMRRRVGEIGQELAELDSQLASLPQTCDPGDPTADLLMLQRFELEREKQALVKALASTATEYKQFDTRWGAIRYGQSANCTNIKAAGCGPTSLAIVLNYLYQEDPESLAAAGQFEIVTPQQTATYAETHGRVCNSGTAGDTMVTSVHTGWPGFQGRRISLAQATDELRSGNLVIFLCKDCVGKNKSGGDKHYGGHFMVLNGVNADATVYNVLDPGANETTDIETISRTELQKHTGGFWIVARQ